MIVIDADIASSAADPATAARARTAYRCLRDWERSPHTLVLVPTLRGEWDVARRNNRHARASLARQTARGRVVDAAAPEMGDVRAALERARIDPSRLKAIVHDFHLLEAARCGALLVLSFDAKVRGHLRKAGRELRPLFPGLRWNNPEKEPVPLAALMTDASTPGDAAEHLFPPAG